MDQFSDTIAKKTKLSMYEQAQRRQELLAKKLRDLQVEENKQTRIKIQYNRQQRLNKKKEEEKKAAEKLAKLGLR